MTDTPEGTGGIDQVPASDLSVAELLAEMASLHRTRHDTLRYASAGAVRTHLTRTAELEREYLRRFPDREVDQSRTR
jgi:hypothetical protein